MKTPKPDQLTRANETIRFLQLLDLDSLSRDLDNVLGEAQNRPPEGMADGSIDEEKFTLLREVEKALDNLDLNVRRYIARNQRDFKE